MMQKWGKSNTNTNTNAIRIQTQKNQIQIQMQLQMQMQIQIPPAAVKGGWLMMQKWGNVGKSLDGGDVDHGDDDGDGVGDDIYIMMSVCLSVTKNHHFLLGVSCDHLNYP